MSHFLDMLEVLELVVKVNRAITLPVLEKKSGLTIVSHGKDFSEVVTQTDLNVSAALLDGGIQGLSGLRSECPGSFSEEQDTKDRLTALRVRQVDPIDGTGDWVASCRSGDVFSPYTLVSKLERKNVSDPFETVAGLVFDTLHQFALVSDGHQLGLFLVDESGTTCKLDYELITPPAWSWSEDEILYINRRVAYPLLTFDGPFIDYLRGQGIKVQTVEVGGAADMGLRVFRNYLKPKGPGMEWFYQLQPLTICFNTESVWKTWDTNPLDAIASALGLPPSTDMYGQPLEANAAAPLLTDMFHRTGYVLSTSQALQQRLCELASEFERRNPDCPLRAPHYNYKDAIVAMAKGEAA